MRANQGKHVAQTEPDALPAVIPVTCPYLRDGEICPSALIAPARSQNWNGKMPIRLQIALLIYMVVQATVFGIGTVLVLATPLSEFAMQLIPWVIGVSALLSAPLSWAIAPRLRARFSKSRVIDAR